MNLSERLVVLTDATSVHELTGGHQSRVFDVTRRDGQRVVAKVLDASLVDADIVATRVETVAQLADIDPRVCRPVQLDGDLVTALVDGTDLPLLVVCYEHAHGVRFDVASVSDAELMGATLAELHVSLRRVAPLPDLPVVAALRAVPPDVAEPFQLLHGDFNNENLRHDRGKVRVFDFDDCGFGPCTFDVANALYMVLFDSTTGATVRYRRFERAFLAGYRSASGGEVERDVVNGLIRLRVRVLESWLDDLATAPIGIRTASPQWHNTLRSFISSYEDRAM